VSPDDFPLKSWHLPGVLPCQLIDRRADHPQLNLQKYITNFLEIRHPWTSSVVSSIISNQLGWRRWTIVAHFTNDILNVLDLATDTHLPTPYLDRAIHLPQDVDPESGFVRCHNIRRSRILWRLFTICQSSRLHRSLAQSVQAARVSRWLYKLQCTWKQ